MIARNVLFYSKWRFPNGLLRKHFGFYSANGRIYFTRVPTYPSKNWRGVRFWFVVVMEKESKCLRSRQLGKIYKHASFWKISLISKYRVRLMKGRKPKSITLRIFFSRRHFFAFKNASHEKISQARVFAKSL